MRYLTDFREILAAILVAYRANKRSLTAFVTTSFCAYFSVTDSIPPRVLSMISCDKNIILSRQFFDVDW